jgi:hypothetical protein
MDPMDMMRHLSRMRSPSEKDYNLTTVDVMTDREAHEFMEIKVTSKQLNDEYNKIMHRKNELEARQTLFWAGLRRCRPALAEVEFLHIHDAGNNKLEIQKGEKKTEIDSNPFASLFGEE